MRSATGILDRFFGLSQHRTSFRVEIMAGLTTYLTMAYIIFVQPAVLAVDFAGAPTGLDPGAVLLATCLVSAGASIFMGLYARYPIALAPGMGENFFFISTIMALGAAGFDPAWQTALGIIFVSGAVFFILSLFRVREAIINAVSPSMKNGIAVGIGLFIAFIGLKNGGIIVAKPGTFVGLSPQLASGDVAVFVFGLLLAGGLQARRVRGAILWAILGSGILAALLGKVAIAGVIGFPQINTPIAFRMDIASALNFTCLPFIVVFIFMDMFDTVGTLVGVSEQAGLMKDNRLPRASQALLVDATGTVAGACLGTSTVTSYIESAAGVAAGGRTGLTSITVGVLFLVSLCFSPLISSVGSYLPVTAPALVVVGALMARNAARIDWKDASESIPAFLVAVSIPLTFSIADGLAIGFISYPVIKLCAGKARRISPLMVVMAIFLFSYFIWIRPKTL